MKLKRLAAATMGFMMVFAVPAYANDADAVAVYQEMNEKQKTLSDVNAYYDFNMSTKSGFYANECTHGNEYESKSHYRAGASAYEQLHAYDHRAVFNWR